MLKSCKYCGRIHDSQYDCGRKPPPQKKMTYIDRFRSSRRWREKREQIRRRDKNLLTVCEMHHEMAESGEIPYEVVKRIIDEQEESQ